MRKNSYTYRLLGLILALTLMLPATVYAEDETDGSAVPETETVTETIETEPEMGTVPAEAEEMGTVPEEPEETGTVPVEPVEEEPEAAVSEPAYLENINIEENPMGTVTLKWDAFEGASCYEVSSPGIEDGAAAKVEKTRYTVSGLDHGVDYDFTLAALDENGDIIARGAISIKTEPYRIKFDEALYRILKNKVLRPKKKLKINLTKMIGEPSSG